MAIKISGTTVIDNSQNITNAGIVTATSFTGDGSQLTNLPGGGGNTLEATASGTLADGSKVIVNADGTVSVVAQTETTGSGVESPVVFNSTTTSRISSVYDSSNQKVVIAYRDGVNGYGIAIVGTVSGTSITFGSPTTFESASTTDISATFDSTNNKVVIAYTDGGNSNYGTAIVGTVSGTSISFGTAAVFESDTTSITGITYDSTNQKVVIAYKDGGTTSGTAVVGTVSGTSISFGTPAVFESGNMYDISPTFDSTNGKVVIAYRNNSNSSYGTAVVGTVSGTSISFGTPVVFNSDTSIGISAVYDPNNQKVVIAYRDGTNPYYGTAIVGTVSGTSISFGTPVVFRSNSTGWNSTVYDSVNQKIVISYSDTSVPGALVIVGTVSGTSISFGSPTVFVSNNIDYISAVYDSTNDKVVIAYMDYGNSSYGTAVVYGNTGFPVPSVGSAEVFESARSYIRSVVYDSTNQKIVILYRDSGNSDYGTAIVGTVSGTSISFGSPVVFESAGTYDINATYDSTNNKVVIVWRDNPNNNYGTAIVGTVSGTSISFGSPVVFNSGGSNGPQVIYDSTNQKVVIAYRNNSNSNYGTAVVGTVSGTSISFGTPVIYESAHSSPVMTFVGSGKVVIIYNDGGNNYAGTAIVGTVSGTSISFGSPVVFASTASSWVNAIAYDPSNSKVVAIYRDAGNSNYSTAVVGTVSGTSISFGTPVVFNSATISYASTTYDSTNNKIVISYQDNGNSGYGTAIVGTVSGTSISFGSSTVFHAANTAFTQVGFDSTNNKSVIAYQDKGNSDYGTAVVFSPRTISNNLTAENYIGISDGAYSDGQTATIQLTGAVDDAQSSLHQDNHIMFRMMEHYQKLPMIHQYSQEQLLLLLS